MIELNNVSFRYTSNEETSLCEFSQENSGRSQSDRSNGSLCGTNLKINEGEFVLFTGGSGCGKTTILRLINGLIPNFFEGDLQGKVFVNGKDVSHAELYDIAKTVSTVFQNPRSQFFNVDTTSELAFACENQGMEESEILRRVDKTVKDLHLEPLMERSLFQLSGGQKQKIACASVAVTGNKIILLDEPSANLDLKTIEELRELLKKWKNEGKTIVVAEHRISYLWELADRAVVLRDGEIIRDMSRSQMNKITEDELHQLGLRSKIYSGEAGHAELVSETYSKKILKQVQHDKENIIIHNFFYKYRNGLIALNIPYMEIPVGKITAITGNNGEGKTTFLNCLCGLGKHSKGTIEFKGKTHKRHARQKQIFLVMQDVNHQLFTESVLDEVLISQKEENEEEAHRILKSLDLDAFAERHPQSLSGGQKQRLAVACAIASGREILLFDEPTSGLDYTHMMQIGQILRNLKELGKTVIVVTHDRELIKECCDFEIPLKEFNLGEQ